MNEALHAKYKWWVCGEGQQREEQGMRGEEDERETEVRRRREQVGVLHLDLESFSMSSTDVASEFFTLYKSSGSNFPASSQDMEHERRMWGVNVTEIESEMEARIQIKM